MSFEPPEGILDIGNATLRVGKLEVAETSGLNQGLLNIVKNNLLITSNTEYASSNTWGIKLPTTWVADFDVKGHSEKYVEFNFYNEGSTSNTSGYTLNFNDTTLSLRYDNGSWTTATIPTIVNTYRKVNIFFERNVIAVSIDGTRVLYYKHAGNPPPVMSRVISTTGSAFVNVFIEENATNSKFKNLRIVNGRFISDQTSNIAFIGGNLGVGVNSPQEALDIRGNMHLTRVSNVSQIKVDSNVVTEYTGPHDRPLRKYPEVAMTADAETASGYKGYKVTTNGNYSGRFGWEAFDSNPLGSSWATEEATYSHSGDGEDANTAGQTAGTFTAGGTNYTGHWIKVELPKAIKLQRAFINAYNNDTAGNDDRRPKKGVFLGSNNDSTWDLVHTFDGDLGWSDIVSNQDGATINFSNISTKYKYILLLVEEKQLPSSSSATRIEIFNIEYYGHEEGSGSLDTTLKTVYNVPATTGTQLEVYYDAKDLTTMPGTVTDLAGGDQNGSVSSATLDITDGIESFNFDGTLNNAITTTLPSTFVGNQVHSVAFWFYYTSTKSVIYPFHIGTNNTNDSIGMFIGDGTDSTGIYLNYFFFGNDCTITSHNPLVVGTWNHVALVHNGVESERKVYINNTQIEFDTISNTGPLSLPASSTLYIGRSSYNSAGDATIKMANFRLYSKVLSAEQIQELYDYQKDYFFGSKSQVTLYKGHLGVGVTEPSGQLELAGDERIQEYPPRALTGYETLVEGHGVFCASASSTYGDYYPWEAFDRNTTDTAAQQAVWHTLADFTSATPGIYNAGASLGGYTGAWLKLKLPYSIKPSKVSIHPRTYNGAPPVADYDQNPKDFLILGSKDDNTWDVLSTQTGVVFGTTWKDFTLSPGNNTYNYFAISCTKVKHGQYFAIADMKYFGTPGPTTLDKGSLSLGRSLDVPRISRYDVDTETPRPEKIILDFDTTKMYDAPGTSYSSHMALDNSGFRRNGNFRGAIGNYYSTADKAFKFIGDGYLQTDYNIISGNPPMSQSIWFNYTGGSIETLYSITAGYSTNNVFWVYVSGDVLTVDFNANTVSFTDPNTGSSAIGPDQWYHLVITYDGNSTIGGRRCYINGVEQVSSAVSGSSANGTLSLGSARVTLGALDHSTIHAMVGLLSNFKLYNVVLEPSEVRKLYRLGRTGRSMVISDTAVGIGREPEVQLDVRGTVRFDNAYIENIFSPSLLGHQTCFGGGSVSYNASNSRLRWSSDIVIIPNHHTNGSQSMHCRIRCPADGETINYYNPAGAHSTSAVTSSGIYLAAWQSLWYTVPDDGPVTSIPSQFMVMDYYSPRFPVLGTNSILIAVRFADGLDNELYFPNIRGRINV